ncbi:hypothetical protein SAMN04490244_1227 [Tranquillimonas rosea]|uniref:Uncharacterized protein n=1 Tax=Tranquillimonas rosea TaxID=641238 RepID=A0A1H9X9L0_9RHOB|nr:hypothetical protein [Tranquillimonas rosea]SES42804.1 hypothetical protein SAMN04490244_1227 [Tranquillimonas rosea]
MKSLVLPAALGLAALSAMPAAATSQLEALAQNKLDRYNVDVDASTLDTQALAEIKFVDTNPREHSRAEIRALLYQAAR